MYIYINAGLELRKKYCFVKKLDNNVPFCEREYYRDVIKNKCLGFYNYKTLVFFIGI